MSLSLRPRLHDVYKAVGGREGLEVLLLDFYSRMAADPMVGFFFDGKELTAIAQMQKAFLMRVMGITQEYDGKAPSQAHLQLAPILPGHFDRRLRILEATARDHGLSEDMIKVWIAFEESFRNTVQAKPKPPRPSQR